MKLSLVAVIALLVAGCESNPRPASPSGNASDADHSFREPFLREKERILSEMVQDASQAVQNAKAFVDQGRASQDQIQRLEAEFLERRIEHDDIVTQLALLQPGTNGSPYSAATAQRAHLDRVAHWLDQIVALRRDLVSLSAPRAEVGRASPNDVMADRMELQRALLRVQVVRMELAESSAAAETR